MHESTYDLDTVSVAVSVLLLHFASGIQIWSNESKNARNTTKKPMQLACRVMFLFLKSGIGGKSSRSNAYFTPKNSLEKEILIFSH